VKERKIGEPRILKQEQGQLAIMSVLPLMDPRFRGDDKERAISN